jgi:2-C-methyl-D-erythritol 4-phosphate cytidylyltransferase
MMALPSLWAVVPAAGVGSRFSVTGEPKQYSLIGKLTVLEHSVYALLQCAAVQQVVIALQPDDQRAEQLPLLQHQKIRFVPGGAERADSVLQSLQYLEQFASESDWVLVHDAARPCLSVADLGYLIEQLEGDAVGGILAVPAVDTLKKVSGNTILETVDRSQIWQAHTPQMFRFGLLLQCLQQVRARQLPVTDEASAIEACGHVARVVEGSRRNIKITYPDDLALAAFYLQRENRA